MSTAPNDMQREKLNGGLDDQTVNTLIEAAKLMGQSLEPKVAIEGILEILSVKMQLKRGRVLLQDKNSNELRIKYSVDLSDEEQARGTYALGEGITGKVMATGNIALIPNVALEPTYLARVTTSTQIGLKPIAYIAVPVVQDEATIGVLAVHPVYGEQTKLKIDLFVLQILSQMISQVLRIKNIVNKKMQQLVTENKLLREEGISINSNHIPSFSAVNLEKPALSIFNPSHIRGYSRVNEGEAPRILDALKTANGNKTAAAKLLGMTPRQLHYRIKKLKLPSQVLS